MLKTLGSKFKTLVEPYRQPQRLAERAAFQNWLLPKNRRLVLWVAWVLLVFAFLSASYSWLGWYDDDPRHYLAYGALLCLGLWLLQAGPEAFKIWAERLVLATAILWMFHAIIQQLAATGGLAEFILGSMALAMLRIMPLSRSAVFFAALALAYSGVLVFFQAFDLGLSMNALLFSVLAWLGSWHNYDAKKLLFKNQRLLQELNLRNQQLTSLAMRDSLTGLPNRRYFDQALQQHWQTRPRPLMALIMADIDHFKRFNDQFGHPEGDRALQMVAKALSAQVGDLGVCVRLGGEEFAIVSTLSCTEAAALAESMRQAVLATPLGLSMSFGLACEQAKLKSPEMLYAKADQALYQAKRNGRNCVMVA